MNTLVFPDATATNWQMMPYQTEDPLGSIPNKEWAEFIARFTEDLEWQGVGYLTIDEAVVPAGKSHRTPGIHTDGNPIVDTAWGPGGGPGPLWVGCGYRTSQYTAASAPGCRIWDRLLQEPVDENGDCSHLAHLYPVEEAHHCLPNVRIELKLGQVHESFALPYKRYRQFVRVCPPSMADWPNYYTPNPLGVLPAGKIVEVNV